MKLQTLLKMNAVIAVLSLAGLYFLDSPLELIPMAGVAWVIISSIETLRKIK